MDGIFEELNVGLVSAEQEVDASAVEFPVAAKRFEQMTGNPESFARPVRQLAGDAPVGGATNQMHGDYLAVHQLALSKLQDDTARRVTSLNASQ